MVRGPSARTTISSPRIKVHGRLFAVLRGHRGRLWRGVAPEFPEGWQRLVFSAISVHASRVLHSLGAVAKTFDGARGPCYCVNSRGIPTRLQAHGARQLGNRLYVGNLAYSVDKTRLEEGFREFGTVVSAQVIMDRETGRSKGFGFVEMGSDGEAQAAISAMNGKSFDGRNLTVNEARPQEPRSGGFGGGMRRSGPGGGRRGPTSGGGDRY